MKVKQYTVLDVIRAYTMTELLQKELLSLDMPLTVMRKKLEKIKKVVESMSDDMILKNPLGGWHYRFDHYFNSDWELKTISLADCGSWPEMGGFPKEFTYGSVLDNAEKIAPFLEDKTKLTVETARVLYLERLMKYAELMSEYIPIVVVEGGLIRQMKIAKEEEKKHYKKCKYDIEDGNHRALALALLGKKEVTVLVGKRVSKSSFLYE